MNTSNPGVFQLFESQAARVPESIALSMNGESLTYAELEKRSRRIAGLLRAKGIHTGDLVGVFLDRSFDLIASFLGILKSGAAYVPLDTHYPPERLGFMVADTGMKLIITSNSLRDRLPASKAEVVEVSEIESELLGLAGNSEPQKQEAFGEDLAYVMYTSGSTGVPKGVSIPHRGIVRLVQNPDYVRISSDDVFLQASPVSFDASTFEIWGALTHGARLVMMPPGQPSLEEFGAVIRKEKVSILWLTAGLFNLMVDERLADLAPVGQLLAGGDVLSVAHVERALAGLPNTQLINGYGPTENTTFTCCHSIRRDQPLTGSVPIGSPIRGTTVHVVDEALSEVADGVEGELVAGGFGLALEYWNRPDLTAERFVKLHFSQEREARFYRTGDRVRRRTDGTIEFLGRIDSQVKLRGFRIELGEVETALRQHTAVRDCAVSVWSDGMGNRSLAAWFVSKGDRAPSTADLRTHVAGILPEHMVPLFWTSMSELPLNPNGKVDRCRLPAPIRIDDQSRREPPGTSHERLLVELWQQLLGGRQIGVTESYFEFGANSLMVAQAHDRLRRQHGFEIQLADLFRFPTIRGLASYLKGLGSPTIQPEAAMPRRAELRAAALNRFKRS